MPKPFTEQLSRRRVNPPPPPSDPPPLLRSNACLGGTEVCGQQTQSNNPQYANYWAPLTRKRHIPPHPAQPRHTNYWALRTRKRHQQEHRPQRPTERSDPTQP